jgi:GTPase SAR1 family protein
MNHSISTMTGKTKIKIVFLGGQAVGKSSIIEKYIHDRFDDTANVRLPARSPPLASTFSPRTSRTRPRTTACSCGTLLASSASAL